MTGAGGLSSNPQPVTETQSALSLSEERLAPQKGWVETLGTDFFTMDATLLNCSPDFQEKAHLPKRGLGCAAQGRQIALGRVGRLAG